MPLGHCRRIIGANNRDLPMKKWYKLFLAIVAVFSCSSSFADQNKVVVVTGASQGLGLATAKHLAKQGYIVYGTVRPSSNTKELDAAASENLFKVVMPLTDEKKIQDVIDSIVLEHGHIDVLINNAAYVLAGTVETCSVKDQVEQFNVNYFGPVRAIQAVLPHMRSKHTGTIINIGSVSGMAPYSPWENYSASKFALRGLSESMAAWLSPLNIHVCIVEPATIKTRGGEEGDDPRDLAILLEKIIESPSPQVRYQFGAFAEDLAKKVYVDPTGDKIRQYNLEYYQSAGLLPK